MHISKSLLLALQQQWELFGTTKGAQHRASCQRWGEHSKASLVITWGSVTLLQLHSRETLNHIYYVNTACHAPIKLLIVPLTYLHINLIAIDGNSLKNLALALLL